MRRLFEQTLHHRGLGMLNKLMNTCSTSLIIREMQIKVIWNHSPPTGMEWLKWKRLTVTNVGKDAEQLEIYIIGRNAH